MNVYLLLLQSRHTAHPHSQGQLYVYCMILSVEGIWSSEYLGQSCSPIVSMDFLLVTVYKYVCLG